MYSSSYKHRPGTVTAFEDAYAKEEFLRRSALSGNNIGCTPYSEKIAVSEQNNNRSTCNTEECQHEIIAEKENPPSQYHNPKIGNSGLLFGMDGGDILLVLLILFFLTDKDSENDGLIPVLLAILLIF